MTCGTTEGFRAHVMRDEEPCADCREAARQHQKASSPRLMAQERLDREREREMRRKERPAPQAFTADPHLDDDEEEEYEGPVCGTRSGYLRHRRRKEPTCAPCRKANAAAERARKARFNRHGPKDAAGDRLGSECGTLEGYQAHLEASSVPCGDCREAMSKVRRRQKRIFQETGVWGEPRETEWCGTRRGHYSHRYHGEESCDACRDYYNAERRGIERDQRKPCGTISAYKRHILNNEEPCAACRVAIREERNKWSSGGYEQIELPGYKCGSAAGYNRHIRNGESPCDECREYYETHQREH